MNETRSARGPTNGHSQPTNGWAVEALMAIVLTFLLGIGNFAMHKAVLESRHPLLREMPWFTGPLGGRIGFATEFILLLGALLLVAAGYSAWGWAYAGYTTLNATAAWLILTRRV